MRLGEVAFDGTRVKANNSRFQTRTAKTLEAKLQALDALFEHLLAESESLDTEQVGTGSPTRLPQELAALDQRRQRLSQALGQVRAADEARRQQGVNPEKNPAQLPTTDPDARVMPNKEGGYAPNYTPVATTDGHRGFIVDCEVTAEVNESPQAVASVDRIEATFGQKPEKFLTDAGNNSGQIQAAMEARGVEFYAPVERSVPQPGNPACREDPTQAVPPEQWPQLPRNDRGQLDKSCFVYDAAQDRYYCPQGHALPFEKTKPEERGGEQVTKRIYRCLDCVGCPLAEACLSKKNQHGRTITRDEYEEVRADGLADGHRSRSKTVQPAAAHRRDDLRSPEAGDGTAAVLVTRTGESEDGMALGLYGLQPWQTGARGGETARSTDAIGHGGMKQGKPGNMRSATSGE